MVPFIDIHCHLDFPDLQVKLDTVVDNAKKEGVFIILTNGIDRNTNKIALELQDKYPEVYAALGIYPPDKKKFNFTEFNRDLEFIKKHKDQIIAIGEIGLDYKNVKDKEIQKKVFLSQLKVAKELNLPVIIHSRKAEDDVLHILEKEKMSKVLIHCFGGKKNLVEKAIKQGYSFSIPTNVVRSEQMQNIVKLVPSFQLFAETDSPFLSPFKDKLNEPAFVIESYKKIAEIKGLTLEETKNIIYQNYQRLF